MTHALYCITVYALALVPVLGMWYLCALDATRRRNRKRPG